MVKELSQLNKFIIESVNPDRLAKIELTENDFKRWSEFVSNITQVLNGYIYYEVNIQSGKISRKLLPVLNGLIDLINKTWSYSQRKNLKRNQASQKVISFYKYTCERLESLLFSLRSHTLFKRLRVTNFMRAEVKMRLKTIHKALVAKLENMSDQSELYLMVPDLYLRQIIKKELTWIDVNNITYGITYLLNARFIDPDGLFEALIAIDFDFVEVLHYRVGLWRASLLDIIDIRKQIEYLVTERHKITEIVLLSKTADTGKSNQLADDLSGYLSELEQFLKQILSLQISAAKDVANIRSARRFPIGLSVPQFGLLIRLQIERGILPKENLSQLFKFFTDHFYTDNAPFISPESLQKNPLTLNFPPPKK
ncbi:hypothetical protein ACRQ5D_34215 [Mucilaginibacter sp. P25]|uniref:hypothetical protein n=1 Tax=Mucilaginibacter sp. P25 TaxID=3423945 RepID=UPI003D7BC3E6